MSSLTDHACSLDALLNRDVFLRTPIQDASDTLDDVVGRRPMRMMTSNVFGVMAAEHLGCPSVELGGIPDAEALAGRGYFQTEC